VQAKPLGRLTEGTRVHGFPRQFGSHQWLRLAAQTLPSPTGRGASGHEVTANDEAWALIDATGLDIGLGELLRQVRVADEPEQSDTTEAWRVVAPSVSLQESSSLKSGVLGHRTQGEVVNGVLHTVGGGAWLKVLHVEVTGVKRTAWMLVDGSVLGQGELLRKVSELDDPDDFKATGAAPEAAAKAPQAAAKAKPKAKAKDSRPKAESNDARPKAEPKDAPRPKAEPKAGPKAEPKEAAAKPKAGAREAKAKPKASSPKELGDLSKWIYHEAGEWGRFRVVHDKVVMRSMPSVKAKMKGLFIKGDVVEGEQRDEWLLLDREISALDLLEGAGQWLLIDGRSVGFGALLERVPRGPSGAYVEAVTNGQAPGAEPTNGRRMPRVLCLTGSASGKAIFAVQAGRLFRRAKGLVEFIVAEGPKLCNDPEAVEIMSAFFKGKPMMMYDEVQFDDRNWLAYCQPREALEWLQGKLREHAPVDGVLGFSQGANFAAMLAAQAAHGGTPLSFVCLISPYAPGYARQLPDLFTDEPLRMPALIVRGEQEGYDEGMKKTFRGRNIDKLGQQKPSEHVARLFHNAQVVTHREGHRVLPEDPQEADRVIECVMEFALQRSRGGDQAAQASDKPGKIEDGATVKLTGLQSAAHLNGEEGVVQRWDEECERWVVTLHSTREPILLKAKNIELLKDVCVKCGLNVGYKKLENGERYCTKCWTQLVCGVCKKALHSVKDEKGDQYCSKCWESRMCVKCQKVPGGNVNHDGDRYCNSCWASVLCSKCKKAAGDVVDDTDRRYCTKCWSALMCVLCKVAVGDQRDENNHRYCTKCWAGCACCVCRRALGDTSDSNGDQYCAKCWNARLCSKCEKTLAEQEDEQGNRYCQQCWLRYMACADCQTAVGTNREENGDLYCDQCWSVHTLCARCKVVAGDLRGGSGKGRYCTPCWVVHERERRDEARKGQSQLFRDLLRISAETARPSTSEGPPELGEDALPFLRRFGLAPPGDDLSLPGDFADTEAGRPPALQPKPSSSQGTCFINSGLGWALEFTSDFEGGNAPPESWSLEKGDEGPNVPTFSVSVAPDRLWNPGQVRAYDKARHYWFFFGVTPLEASLPSEGISFRLKVRGMLRQEDLFENGYAPVVHSPSCPLWRRVDEALVHYQREKDVAGEPLPSAECSWKHRLGKEDAAGTTYFAFCYPFSFADLQGMLARIERALSASPGAQLGTAPVPRLGCLHQLHAGCAYMPFGDQVIEPPDYGQSVYFHRQLFARTPQGRTVEILTITEALGAPVEEDSAQYDELPAPVQEALGGLPSSAPLVFPGRPICFASARVHPGESPSQFAMLGLLQFLLSDDPRAALLRSRFVFKLVPMMNPDGVAWGHSRTNSHGHDLNRCYQEPTPEQHEAVAAVKVQLQAWAARGDVKYYADMHAHAGVRGCFLYGNMQPTEEAFFWSVAYGHAVQLNCPHLDIDKCAWSTAPGPKPGQPDYGSGRGQMGRCCKVPLAYTLECNYNTGRLCRPVADAPGLPASMSGTQLVREDGAPRAAKAEGRFAPVAYDPCAWAAVGEALAVALLDIQADNPYSRLLTARPPKLLSSLASSSGQVKESAQHPEVLAKLGEFWETLSSRHRLAQQLRGLN